MAITTLDGVIAGKKPSQPVLKSSGSATVAGRAFSLWGAAGFPGAGAFSASLAGATLDSSAANVAGQIPFVAPGASKAYLARLVAQASQPGTLLLMDRLWHNGGITITSTSAQTVNSPTLPARDMNGATAGKGVIAMVEASVATGAGTPTLTLGYTNSAGTAGRSAGTIIGTAASIPVGTAYLFGLQAGDEGVRSIQTYTQNATWTSGTIHLSLNRILASLPLTAAQVPNALDALTGEFNEMFAGTVPYFVFIPQTTTAPVITGSFQQSNG